MSIWTSMISRLACGLADCIVSATVLAGCAKILIAPAMNDKMYSHKAVKANISRLKEWGYDSHISRGVERTLIGAVGAPEGEKERIAEQLSRFPNVDRVVPILKPYKLVSRESQAQTTRVQVGEVETED